MTLIPGQTISMVLLCGRQGNVCPLWEQVHSEGKFVGDCSLFALFLLRHKRFHCFPLSLSLLFEKEVDCYFFFFFFFTQRVAQEQRPIVSSNIKRTICACHMQGNARN